MTQTNPRADTASMVMNNPKLQKMLQEALDSPIGSTKRQKAKSVIQSLHQARANYSGQGGYQDGQGGILDQGLLPWMASKAPAAIGSAINTGKQAAGDWIGNKVQDIKNKATIGAIGLSGTMGLIEKAKSIPKATAKNVGAFVFGPSVNEGQEASLAGMMGTPLSETTGGKVAQNIATQNPLKATILSGIPKKAPTGATVPSGAVYGPAAPISGAQTYLDAATGKITNPFIAPISVVKEPTTTTTKKPGTAPATTTAPSAAGTFGPAVPTGFTSDSSGIISSSTTSSTGAPSSAAPGTGTTDTEGKTLLQQLADQQVGGDMAAMIIMNDEAKWKEVFPNTPYPGGASLTRQTQKLFDTLKKEASLDEQQKALLEKQAQGATLEQDFNDYVHGKDTYVKELDGMIDSNLNLMATTDMSDPFVRKQMGKYMDYLYLLKGRQLKSYASYIDSSIDQYNAEVANMENKYNADYKNFLEEYSKKAAITEEDYNMYKTAIKSMYDNLAGLEESELKLDILRNQRDSSSLELLTTIADANGTNTNTKRDPMTEVERAAYNRELGLNPDGSALTDKDGNPIPGLKASPDLYSIMARLDNQGFRGKLFSDLFMENIKRDVSGNVYNGDIDTPAEFYKKTLKSIDAAVANGTADPEQAKIDKQTVTTSFLAGVNSGLSSYFTKTDTNMKSRPIDSIKTALNDLVGKGWMSGGAFGTSAKDRTTWVNRYAAKGISKDILNAIYDQYTYQLSLGSSPVDFLNNRLGADEQSFINSITADIDASLYDPTTFNLI